MAYKMTARRRAALKKAQLASARKRRKGKKRKSYRPSAVGARAGKRASKAIRYPQFAKKHPKAARRIGKAAVTGSFVAGSYAGLLLAGSVARRSNNRRR